jgi:hypothetical protein
MAGRRLRIVPTGRVMTDRASGRALGLVLTLATWAMAGGFSKLAAETRETEAALSRALESIRNEDISRHTHFLAGDALEGRKANSRGGTAAGVFLVEQMQKYGIKPAGIDGGYFQPFDAGRNILGVLPGTDPQVKHEVVLVCAHYDHVGYGNVSNSFGPIGQIHNGADDNASGTAGLLEVMQALTESGLRPRRTLLFAFWDAEEDGLLGSEYWARHPTIPLDRIRVAVNVDMIGRLRERKLEVYGTRTAPGLREIAARANATGLLLDLTWDMEPNSDHYTFFARQIPAMMLHTGLHDQYHRPSDDVETLNTDGITETSRYLLRLTLALADANALPGFRSESQRENASVQRYQANRRLPDVPPRLGVQWADATAPSEEKPGVAIAGVIGGSAAERAGIRRGEELISFDGIPVTDVGRLVQQIWQADGPTPLTLRAPGGASRVLTLELDGSPIRVGMSAYSDEAEPGVSIVSRVIPGTAADRAGLRKQDRVCRVNDQSFADSQELAELLRTVPGPLQLQIERDGSIMTLKVDVAPAEGWRPRTSDSTSQPAAAPVSPDAVPAGRP